MYSMPCRGSIQGVGSTDIKHLPEDHALFDAAESLPDGGPEPIVRSEGCFALKSGDSNSRRQASKLMWFCVKVCSRPIEQPTIPPAKHPPHITPPYLSHLSTGVALACFSGTMDYQRLEAHAGGGPTAEWEVGARPPTRSRHTCIRFPRGHP